jgi:oligopeptide/dipeptide ABC transporter ATP-binding protein
MSEATVMTTAIGRAGPREPLLAVENLRVEFAGRRVVHAVRGLSYTIAPGETLGLVGESGSGKSVSALALLGLLPKRVGRITAGSVRLEGRELVGLPEDQLRHVRGARIAMIFQDPLSSLNPVLTVGRQITESLETHRRLKHKAASKRAVELLDMVGIPAARRRVDDYPHQFSGGMRQRAMIAMALACEPALLIADEPTTALDVTIRAQILDLLGRLRADLNMAVLMITHDLGVVAGFADRLAVMYAGRIVETGQTEDVLARPEHPYTVGLLHSLPRLDRPRQAELKPIGGAPPDLAGQIVGCPFGPRCAWRLDLCWSVDPEMLLADRGANVDGRLGPSQHFVACHDRPTFEEVVAGRPLRPGFAPAALPGQVVEALVESTTPSADETLVVFEEGTFHAIAVAADVGRATEAASATEASTPREDPDPLVPGDPPQHSR